MAYDGEDSQTPEHWWDNQLMKQFKTFKKLKQLKQVPLAIISLVDTNLITYICNDVCQSVNIHIVKNGLGELLNCFF